MHLTLVTLMTACGPLSVGPAVASSVDVGTDLSGQHLGDVAGVPLELPDPAGRTVILELIRFRGLVTVVCRAGA